MFAHGQTFTRLRAPLVADPYSGENTLPDWENAATLSIPGFGFDPGGSMSIDQVSGQRIVTEPTLSWLGADVPDVRVGDRMRGPDGRVWHIAGHPSIPTNPFTGWQPGATWPLRLIET